MNTVDKEKAINRCKKHMEWIASIDTMEPMRKADQCYGVLIGMEMVLDIDDYGKEWDELTEYWENLRGRILGYIK